MRKKADEDCQHLQTYQVKPDYARCVSIVASASLREMIKPGALAVISPIVLGAYYTHILVLIIRSLHKVTKYGGFLIIVGISLVQPLFFTVVARNCTARKFELGLDLYQ
jgi:Na+/H+-translocating membrane pyrophosphatase